MGLRHSAMLVLVCALIPSAMAQPSPNGDTAQTVVHLLDYVGVDYPEFVKDGKVLDESDYAVQFTARMAFQGRSDNQTAAAATARGVQLRGGQAVPMQRRMSALTGST